MVIISKINEFKERLQGGFENNESTLAKFGKNFTTQLKSYLIETNNTDINKINTASGKWVKMDKDGWYILHHDDYPNTFFLNKTYDRVWIIHSLLEAKESDLIVDKWVNDTRGLDYCWLSRNHLLNWKNRESWKETGVGLRFSDGLRPEDEAGNFSLKAWYGAERYLDDLESLIDTAKENFAIYSSRWQKKDNHHTVISSEWYSNGKVTINRAEDVDEVLIHISEMAEIYNRSIIEATKLRDNTLGAFELEFTQEIDLDAFSTTVTKGTGNMKLWLIEVESEDDFRRFKGIDLHTWDRVLLDVGLDYAYLSVPGKGCVNAAPRIAVVQGEDNTGKTSIYHDGVEIFG